MPLCQPARARSRWAGRVALRRAVACAAALALWLALAVALAATACRPHAAPRTEEPPVARPPIAEVLARHTPAWMSLSGVVGTAQGADAHGAPVILVLLAKDDAAVRKQIPSTVEGWPVRFDVTGPIRALGDSAR